MELEISVVHEPIAGWGFWRPIKKVRLQHQWDDEDIHSALWHGVFSRLGSNMKLLEISSAVQLTRCGSPCIGTLTPHRMDKHLVTPVRLWEMKRLQMCT